MNDKRYSRKAVIAAAVIAAAVTLALTLGAVALTAWLRLWPGGIAVMQSMELIRTRFVGEADGEKLADSAVRGMVDAIGDRWSYYLSKEDYARLRDRLKNEYIGVGFTYRPNEDKTALEVATVLPGSPAERAGLRAGERITAIDAQPITPDSLAGLIAAVAEPGRTTVFTVEDETGALRDLAMTAASIQETAVFYDLRESGVGYVRIFNFYTGSGAQAVAAVDDLLARGARALLFDVRSNPGGYVQELTPILDRLLPEGPIFIEHSYAGRTKRITSDAECVDLPMAVLVNADSYSAAEFFAAQLRESAQADIIGVQTCGKGRYQQTFSLANGGGLNISTGTYTTGGGASLLDVGVVPDVVEDDPARQLERGEECLQEKLR